MLKYKENKYCLVCNAEIHNEFLNLNDQPLANSYHHGIELEKYPLRMKVCTNCWHSQLSISVEPSEMFENYLYISDTSKTLKDYFVWAKNYIKSKSGLNSGRVLEIACNSGLFLEMFQSEGFDCIGVDPAKNIEALSIARNLKVYTDFWTKEFSLKFKSKEKPFDLILAFHVLPHVPNPNEFIEACLQVLAPNGKIFIQTSQCDMLLNNEFDVIYHEHSSYFTGSSIKKLANNYGLYVSSIIKTDIHSKSFLFCLEKNSCDETELKQLLEFENNNNIYSLKKYHDFCNEASNIKNDLLKLLNYYKNENYTIIGYGAAAKGNTLLNYIDFKLDFIIDDNYMKWNYLTPGQNIEILNINLLNNNFDKICFLPLAWNFYDEIKNRISEVRSLKNDVFIKYFPCVSVETFN